MNINFTDKEYRLLLDVVFLADWVLKARDAERAPGDDVYHMLFQKVYSHAREMGCADLVTDDVESNLYVPAGKFEEQSVVFDWIEDYEESAFWEQLLDRLVERDVYASLPAGAAEKLGEEEYWRRAAPYERRYAEELYRHGLDRLVVDDGH